MQCRGVLQVVDIPVVTQRLIPMVRVTMEISRPLCATTGALVRSSVSADQQGRLHPVVAQSLILIFSVQADH